MASDSDPLGAGLTSPLAGLSDTHCHLDDRAFDADRAEVLARAMAAGVERILIPGTDLNSSRKAEEIARGNRSLRFSAGVHPHESQAYSAEVEAGLRELARRSGIAAIGEIGLDYYRDLSPRPGQREAFRAQLRLAAELDLPVIVHIRDAAEDALQMLEEAGRIRGVLHAFSGDNRTADRAIALGLYFGAAGPITYKKAEDLRSVFRRLPEDRILLETDSPYLPPDGWRGKRNEPARVADIARRLARERGASVEQLADSCRRNANRLFGWE